MTTIFGSSKKKFAGPTEDVGSKESSPVRVGKLNIPQVFAAGPTCKYGPSTGPLSKRSQKGTISSVFSSVEHREESSTNGVHKGESFHKGRGGSQSSSRSSLFSDDGDLDYVFRVEQMAACKNTPQAEVKKTPVAIDNRSRSSTPSGEGERDHISLVKCSKGSTGEMEGMLSKDKRRGSSSGGDEDTPSIFKLKRTSIPPGKVTRIAALFKEGSHGSPPPTSQSRLGSAPNTRQSPSNVGQSSLGSTPNTRQSPSHVGQSLLGSAPNTRQSPTHVGQSLLGSAPNTRQSPSHVTGLTGQGFGRRELCKSSQTSIDSAYSSEVDSAHNDEAISEASSKNTSPAPMLQSPERRHPPAYKTETKVTPTGHLSMFKNEEKVFFRAGGLAQLEDARDEKITGTIVALQAYCRGYLGRSNLKKLKLQHMAVSCIQRNVRKFMAIREWPWWRLYTKVQPLLNVHRTEEELRDKEVELEQLKVKVEKLDKERTEYKHTVDKLETKLSEMTADFAEEHTTSNQATELLDAETSQRMRLEKELKDLQGKHGQLQRRHDQMEMDLMQAHLIVASIDGDIDDDDNDGDSVYRQKYERLRREMDLLKKKQEQQQEEQEERYTSTKKQYDRKLTESHQDSEEQRRQVANLKRKSQRLNTDMQDMKLHLEEQVGRNAELEKKQRKFDAEMQKVNETLKLEHLQREKLQRERDQLASEKFTLEQQLKNVTMDHDLQSEKVLRLDRELTELTSTSRDDKEIMTLKRLRNELEAKLAEQEEELDDQAGTIQQLEQAKLRLEMATEKLRQQNAKELEEKEEELEEMRANTQKKIRSLELQVEEEYEEKQSALREKREMERKMQAAAEQESPVNRETEKRLRRDLKRTRALLSDAQLMLEKAKDVQASRATIKQLRNQLEDAEYGMAVAIKARKGLELEVVDLQTQVDDLTKAKHDMEERVLTINREKSELQTKVEENDEDMAEVMKKFKAAVQQQSVDQITLQDQSAQIEQLTAEREILREQLTGLQSSIEYMQSSMVDKQASARLEAKIRDLESRLDLEQTGRHRAEVQLARLKENTEQLTTEKEKRSEVEAHNVDMIKRLQRQLRDTREELSDAQRKETEANQRKQALDQKVESVESDYEQAQSDLRLAFKRISDLQAVIEDDIDTDDDDEDSDVYLSDEDDDDSDDSDLDLDSYLVGNHGDRSASALSSDTSPLRPHLSSVTSSEVASPLTEAAYENR